MKHTVLWLCGLCFIWSVFSCISFKVEPPPDPSLIVREATLCREIDESGELLEPGEAVSDFRAGRDPVICFLHLRDVARRVGLKWKWYSPDNALYKESEEVFINREEIYIEAVTAYDMISPESPAEEQGLWSVAVLVNDVLLVRLTFRVVPDTPRNQ